MNVYEMWKQKVNSESGAVWMSIQIRELCEWREESDCTFQRINAKLLLMIYVQIKFL